MYKEKQIGETHNMIKTIAKATLAVNEVLSIKKSRIQNETGKRCICVVTGIHRDKLEGQYLVWLLRYYLQAHMGATGWYHGY